MLLHLPPDLASAAMEIGAALLQVGGVCSFALESALSFCMFC